MTDKLLPQSKTQAFVHILPVSLVCILKRKENNRISALKFAITLPAGPDLLIRKINRSILIASFKISAKHIHHQCLAKTAGTCKKIYLAVVINNIPDQQSLVHIITLSRYFPVRSDPHRTGQPSGCYRFDTIGCLLPKHWRPLYIRWDHPESACLICTGNHSVRTKLIYAPWCNIPLACHFLCPNKILLHKTTSFPNSCLFPIVYPNFRKLSRNKWVFRETLRNLFVISRNFLYTKNGSAAFSQHCRQVQIYIHNSAYSLSKAVKIPMVSFNCSSSFFKALSLQMPAASLYVIASRCTATLAVSVFFPESP